MSNFYILIALVSLLVSCTGQQDRSFDFARITPTEDMGPEPDPDPNPDPTPVGVCTTTSFQQEASVQKLLDVVMFLDTSGSMGDFRNAVAGQFDKLYDTIRASNSDLDLQVATVLSWANDKNPNTGERLWSGRLFNASYASCSDSPASSRPTVLHAAVGDNFESKIKNPLKCILQNIDSHVDEESLMNSAGILNAEGEAGLLSAHNLSTTYLAEAKSQGFFRDGAALGAIFATDENDACVTVPGDSDFVKTTDGPGDTEYNFVKNSNKCAGINAANTYMDLSRAINGRPLTIGALVRTQMTTNGMPLASDLSNYYKHFGLGYLGLPSHSVDGIIDLAGANGFVANLTSNATAVAAALSGMGQVTGNALNKKTQFQVSNDAVTVQWVKVDGREVSYDFKKATHTVQIPFESAGSNGDSISIHWCPAAQ